MRGLWYDRSLNYSTIFNRSFFRAHDDFSAFCLALRLTLGVAVAYQSEIPVSIWVLADVLEGHISPLEEVLVSFVLEGEGEAQKSQHASFMWYILDGMHKKMELCVVCNTRVSKDVNSFTFLSSTTTSVLCLLIVCGWHDPYELSIRGKNIKILIPVSLFLQCWLH